MTIQKITDDRTIIRFIRSSIFGAAVESSAPFQLIDNMMAEVIAARTTTAAAIFAIGMRLLNTGRDSIDARRRDALPSR